MKLATLKDTTRDGKLVVVSKDLTRCSEVGHIARSLQAALDDWAHAGPRLQRVAQGLETGSQPTMRFHEHDATSPLPRGYHWSAGSGSFGNPRDPISLAGGTSDIAMTAQLAAIVDDVEAGSSGSGKAILLVLIAQDLLADGKVIGSTFSPVAVTPDELDGVLTDGKATASLLISHNGKPLAPASADADFGEAVTTAAKVRAVGVGAIVACTMGATRHTLASGDTVRIELNDKTGHSIFGAIEQEISVRSA